MLQVGVGGDQYSLGMREVLSGTAQATLDHYVQIVDDIQRVSGTKDAAMKITAAIKNTMSDRHIVQKTFNDLLRQYRAQVLPAVVTGWRDISDDDKQAMSSMHNLFCGMHYVVNMAETVSEALKLYEKLYLNGGLAGAALLAQNPAKNSTEAGAVRLIRTACKALERHGSEQSGYPEDFAAFLASHGVSRVPLDSFRGNRFNILFHNAAGLYFLRNHASSFLSSVFDRPNLLLQAVAADLKEPLFLAGVRALGLIDKHLSSPLWKLLENKTVSILGMNDRYTNLYTFLSTPGHAAGFMTGESVPFPGVAVDKDDKWIELVTPCSSDSETEVVLEALFASLSSLTRRLLHDHLPGGKLHSPSASLQAETVNVAKTNTVSERDFAMLDRMMREKPNASTAAIEGMILYANNKTAAWLEGHSASDRDQLFQKARELSPSMYQIFRLRRRDMISARAAALQRKQKELAEKRKKAMEKKEELSADIAKDGLWQTQQDIESGLQSCPSESSRIQKLKTQLNFRKKVLCQDADSSLFAFSCQGRKLASSELKAHLIDLFAKK